MLRVGGAATTVCDGVSVQPVHAIDATRGLGSEDGSSDPSRPDMTQSLSESGAGSPQSFVFKPIASFWTLEGLPTRG